MLSCRPLARGFARVVALVVALAMTAQLSGVAGAFELGATVSCCCGEHDAGHHCGCPDCPGHGDLRLSGVPSQPTGSPATPSYRPCAGRARLGVLPSVPLSLPPAAPGLAEPRATVSDVPVEVARLHDRLIPALRPPP